MLSRIEPTTRGLGGPQRPPAYGARGNPLAGERASSILVSSTTFAVIFLVLATSCSKSPSDTPASATIAGTPTPDVLLAPTGVAETTPPAPTETPHSAELVVPVRPPTPVPTVDVASIPNSDRPREPESRTLREQLVRCLTFTLSKQDFGPITERHIVRVEVHARSSCPDLTFVGEQAFFEVRARDRTGNLVARQVGQFQSPIRPLGEAVTFVDLAATIEDRLEVSVY